MFSSSGRCRFCSGRPVVPLTPHPAGANLDRGNEFSESWGNRRRIPPPSPCSALASRAWPATAGGGASSPSLRECGRRRVNTRGPPDRCPESFLSPSPFLDDPAVLHPQLDGGVPAVVRLLVSSEVGHGV